MKTVFYERPAEFMKRAGEILLRNEAANSLMLGLVKNARPDSKQILMTLEDASQVVSAAVHTPFNLVLTFASRDDLETLADDLASRNLSFPGVVGPAREAEDFAGDWSTLKKLPFHLAMDQGIYRLSQVTFPQNMPGQMRTADETDVPRVQKWLEAFHQEALRGDPSSGQRLLGQADARVREGRFFLWEDKGQVVAMAATTGPTQNGIRLNSVFTPPEWRRRGYASALMAQLSQKLLESGFKFCFLYTDLNNPTSNRIYQNVGYQMVSHSRHFFFS